MTHPFLRFCVTGATTINELWRDAIQHGIVIVLSLPYVHFEWQSPGEACSHFYFHHQRQIAGIFEKPLGHSFDRLPERESQRGSVEIDVESAALFQKCIDFHKI